MKKIHPGKSKKQRGVALVFTLGILGLLTVVALGFASTALINRKVAENCGNISYAQSIAQSIALSKIIFAFRNAAQLDQLYSYDTTSTAKDFLWTLDTSLNDTALFTYSPSDTTNPMNKSSWQYVKDPNGKILGRYAYVVIPDKGRLDPSVNVASGTTINGASEIQIGINNTTWSNLLNAAVSASPNYRWTTFWDVFNKLNTDITSAQKKTFFSDGVNVGQVKYPEAYWVDNTSSPNDKKDSGELYRRFNLNRSDWETLTVADLIGSDNTAFSSADTVDAMKGIPWLKNWSYASTLSTDWTADRMKKQIAANIIQYNRAATSSTVTDLADSADWTTTAPAYAGVGKHPMLNEIGFKLNTQATLSAAPYPDAASPTAFDYTLTYVFNVSFGTELIDMFQTLSAATDRKTSEITLPSWAINATHTWLSGTSPQTFNSHGQFLGAVIDQSFNSSSEGTVGKVQTIDGSVWWNTSYTPSTSFWQDYNVTKTFSFRINSSTNFSSQIEPLLKIKNISVTPGNAVLKYDSVQRDFATLPSSSTDTTEYDAKVERTFTFALEANDPRVNHYGSDWKNLPLSGGTAGALQATTTEATNYGGSIGICNTLTGINASDRDKGTTTDPGYGISNKRIASAFIRNGTMQSVWELGCISRAEAWRTLNFTRTNNAATPDYTYAKGDGKILDQVKLTDSSRPEGPNFKYGKVNANSDVTPVFRALVDDTRFPWYNSDFETSNSSQTTLLNVTTGANLNTTSTPIVSATYPHASTCECLACKIQLRSRILPFYNRSDLLVDATDVANLPGYSSLTATQKSDLATIQGEIRTRMLSPLYYPAASPPSGTNSTTKAAQEQLLGKLMPLLRTEASDMVYVVVAAQTIRDIGGTKAFVDFDNDGETTTTSVSITADKKYQKTGYVKYDKDTSSWVVVGTPPSSLNEQISSTATGTYEIGADKITSETKLIAVLVQDPVTRKWRIARYQYVE